MTTKTKGPAGRAKHPHNSRRPESAAVKLALEADDIEALELALSPRQRAFAKEYVVDFNGTAAAVRAGYATEWADRYASTLRKHKGVARLIDYYTTSKEAKITAIDPDYVISQVTAVIHKEGVRDGDKLRALELLARHLGMFIDRTEITGKDGEAIRIENQKVAEEAEGFLNQVRRMAKKTEVEIV
jgi:phage terminase small subunit